ncbi:hypothetical protein Adu01nite_22520 [Paractinoplanes durhamensis]|uniref:Secreted protein n=1 Tax=Paractinoplanes durhamensis TaxID=113563 RepID=A0ABQ3YTG8_9ACTN|nr:hypothetical protein Adu01nite_22520 [Actinoplanes durhamensis]
MSTYGATVVLVSVASSSVADGAGDGEALTETDGTALAPSWKDGVAVVVRSATAHPEASRRATASGTKRVLTAATQPPAFAVFVAAGVAFTVPLVVRPVCGAWSTLTPTTPM